MPEFLTLRTLAAAVAVLGLAAGATAWQPSEDEAGELTLDDLQQELHRLREDNARMQGEIDELCASTTDDWMTEQRAEEIRELVADVLADADTRASNLNSGLTAGWSEHFFLASPDGRFKLQLEGHLQFRWIASFHNADGPGSDDRFRHGYEITRTKLTFSGHVFDPDVTYLLRMDQTRNEPGLVNGLFFVRDAWVRYRIDNDWSVRVGQFKVPFNREELVSSAYQLAVERSLVNESLNLGRSQGIELTWATDRDQVMFMVSDGAVDSLAGFNSLAGGQNPVNEEWSIADVEWAFTARWERLYAGQWKQFEDFTSPPGEEFAMLLGLAGHVQRTESTGERTFGRRDEHLWAAITTDASIEYGGASVFGSIIYEYTDHGQFGQWRFIGVVLQGGMYVTSKLETYARFEYGWIDSERGSINHTDLTALTIGTNYYIDGHDLKWTTDLGIGLNRIEESWDADIAGWRVDPEGADPQIVFRTQLQLLF